MLELEFVSTKGFVRVERDGIEGAMEIREASAASTSSGGEEEKEIKEAVGEEVLGGTGSGFLDLFEGLGGGTGGTELGSTNIADLCALDFLCAFVLCLGSLLEVGNEG